MHKLVSYTVIIVFIVIWLLLYYRNNFLIPKILKEFRPRHNNITKLLKIIIPLLEKHNIQYYIDGGTCLGYARHNKTYIPWDDDLDLAIIYNKDTNNKIKLFKKDLSSSYKNIIINNVWFGYQVKTDNAYIDFFIYKKKNDSYYSEWDTKMFFPQDTILPLKKDYFDGVLVNIPNNYKKYLKIMYGKDCLKSYKLTKIHKHNLDNIISFVLQEFPIYVKT